MASSDQMMTIYFRWACFAFLSRLFVQTMSSYFPRIIWNVNVIYTTPRRKWLFKESFHRQTRCDLAHNQMVRNQCLSTYMLSIISFLSFPINYMGHIARLSVDTHVIFMWLLGRQPSFVTLFGLCGKMSTLTSLSGKFYLLGNRTFIPLRRQLE